MYATHGVLGDRLPTWSASYCFYLNSTVSASIKLLPVILASRRLVIAEHTSEQSLDLVTFLSLSTYSSKYTPSKRNRPGTWEIINGVPSDHRHFNGYVMVEMTGSLPGSILG